MNILFLSMAMAKHAARQQSQVAQNIANVETPGYKAKFIAPFSEAVSEAKFSRSGEYRFASQEYANPGSHNFGSKQNGNNVQMLHEMSNSVTAMRQHERAISIYKNSLKMLRVALSKQ